MRHFRLAVLTAIVVVAAISGALAAERPLAALVPADVSTYSEMNLDSMLGRTPANAAVGQALAQMKSPAMIAQMWSGLSTGDQGMAKVSEILALLKGASGAIGPRVGIAIWIPDAQSLMGAMSGGAGGGAQNPMSVMPKLLFVADVKDAAKLDSLVSQIAQAGTDVRVTDSTGTKTMSLANGMVDLVRGDTWMALGFPPEQARKAADLIAGTASDSLAADPGYQGVIGRLPADAALVRYFSAPAVRQIIAMVNLMAPNAGFAYTGDQPLGVASGLRVETVSGKQMATVYWTADLDTIPYLIDAPLTLAAAAAKPMIEQQRAEAKATAEAETCASQLEGLAAAMQAYLDEHDNVFPSADGWVEAIRPYVDDPKAFKCPDDPSDGLSSYGMNQALSGQSSDDIEDPGAVVLFYETAPPGANPSGDADDVISPPRHSRGNNFAFVDGTVDWYEPDAEEQPSFDISPSGEET